MHRILFCILMILCIGAPGCVRRTARFTTEPMGARVFVNDREIGRTPATMEFLWYGDYDVIYRLDGYETVRTHVRLDPPLYQLFPVDFIAEVLWPGEIHDHREVPTQSLTVREPADPNELARRAREFRDEALTPTTAPTTESNATPPGN